MVKLSGSPFIKTRAPTAGNKKTSQVTYILFPCANSLVSARGHLASRACGPIGPQTLREGIPRTFTRQRRDGVNIGGASGPCQQTRAAHPRSRVFSQEGGGEVTTYINYVVTINPHVDIFQARAPNQETKPCELFGPRAKSAHDDATHFSRKCGCRSDTGTATIRML